MIFWAVTAQTQPSPAFKVGDFAEMTAPKGAPVVVTIAAVMPEGYQVDFGGSDRSIGGEKITT